jgi:hypothetical protein
MLSPRMKNIQARTAVILATPAFQRSLQVLLAGILGLGLFLAIYGYYPLPFSHLGWIFNSQNDSLQHFLGWQFFRNDPWGFPLGSIVSYGYPIGTSLTYTDSLPLLSIPLKLFSQLLKTRFQFFGVWILACFMLQAYFSILILGEFTRKWLPRLLGAALLLLSPILLDRSFMHNALTGQWIILLAIYLLLRARKADLKCWSWSLVFALAVLVHPYFLFMLSPVFLAAQCESVERSKRIGPALRQTLAAFGTTLLTGALIGLFAVPGNDLSSSGFGQFSFNFNGFVNPGLDSAFWPALPLADPGQSEGFAYLGLGNILLCGAGLVLFAFSGSVRRTLRRNKYVLLAGLLLALVSASSRITFGSLVLVDLPLPDTLSAGLGVIRSSGRLIWPVFYLLVFFGLIRTLTLRRLAPILLAGGLILQVMDLQPLIDAKRFQEFSAYNSPLESSFWKSAPDRYKNIVLLPAKNLQRIYQPLAIYAASNNLTINWGYFARANYDAIEAYGQAEFDRLRQNNIASDSIYVFCDLGLVHQLQIDRPQPGLDFFQLDGYWVGLAASNDAARDQPALSQVSPASLDVYRLDRVIQAAYDDQKIVILSARSLAVFQNLDGNARAALEGLGLKLSFSGQPQDAYLAVFGKPLGAAPVELSGAASVHFNVPLNEQFGAYHLPFNLDVASTGVADGGISSIQIDGKEYSQNREGLHVVFADQDGSHIKYMYYPGTYPRTCP